MLRSEYKITLHWPQSPEACPSTRIKVSQSAAELSRKSCSYEGLKVKVHSHSHRKPPLNSPLSIATRHCLLQVAIVASCHPKFQFHLPRPPLPEANTNMDPSPLRPLVTPSMKARVASSPGPSTVLPLSSGPQLAE